MKICRFKTPDILKGVAVILMIQVHIMELFADPQIYSSWIGRLSLFLGGPPAAPVFMAVMGYFVARSQKTRFKRVIRGLKLIGLGFLLNLGLNMHVLIRIFSGEIQLNPWNFIFGVDILFVAGLGIIIIALLRPLLRERVIAWLALALLVAAANPWLPVYSGQAGWLKYLQAYFWGYYSWSYFPVFPWMGYVLLGFSFSLLDKKYGLSEFSVNTRFYSALILFVILAFTFTYGSKVSAILEIYYHHNLLYFIWASGFLLFWIILWDFLVQKFDAGLFSYLRWVGKNVTSFYVFQWLLIGNTATAIYKTQALWSLPLWFAGVLALSSIITQAFVRIRQKTG